MAEPSSSVTSVHPQETKCKWASYSDFRHRTDHSERSAVISAMLQHPDQYAERAETLRSCGDNAWIYQHKRTTEIRVRSNYCHDRWCPACARGRRHTISETLRHAVSNACKTHTGYGLSLLTLTLRSSTRPLREQMTHLRSAFALLRRRSFFASACLGGLVACEVTLNTDTLEWHPHLHCLLITKYIRRTDLVRHWAQITKGSHVLDIRRVPAAYNGVNYITKYITKPVTLLPLDNWHRLEAIQAFTGRRMYSIFGILRNTEIPEKAEREPFIAEDWHDLGSVTDYIRKANAGDKSAVMVLAKIGFYTETHYDNPQRELEFEP